ncbi:protein-methionine-sulfoxide reductase catalytic subunit MsrP [Paraglaciecola hydrolytica]|uniref:Protein-methionine-sulfoxide reductase catalytic subunit MsrP n=1 Tax=Paraglaciecola hydrolytica TaxID=1799789 RepID=A0A136A1E6_9ALTE|nr:protein-methionine-sulfoxide reductase catalytic subunit MsrP [Paraglaciecola hydrolytica]KXI29023.1 mononuclear molybdenum enzyme YedY [Paraglaciecola hydrolytica]
MLIKIPAPSACKENQVTDEKIYHQRRAIIKSLGFMGAASLLHTSKASAFNLFGDDEKTVFATSALDYSPAKHYVTDDIYTPEDKVINYNNFYEFGTGKSDPVANAQGFKVDPWHLTIDGMVEKPITLGYDDLFKKLALEERIYRLRCVEAWSMVIPWIGFSLADLIKQAQPLSGAKYVAFETLYDPKQMPGQRSRFSGGGIDYPYVEGLRIDEAMHPLAFMAVGLYGKTLPPQNGAPIRLVVPWKYGFKSIKSITRIKLTDKKPPTTWNLLGANEYGFYANVNPEVDHPRWTQASERRITTGGLFNQSRIPTQMFNGYDEVAPLYKNLDLRRNY